MTHPAVLYVEAGLALVPIPRGSKGPTLAGWQTQQAAIRDTTAAAKLNGGNIGLAHRWCGTCCLDVDDYERASAWLQERGVDLAALLSAEDAVQIHSGKPNRAKLLYRLPLGIDHLPTKQPPGSGVEFRCANDDGTGTVQDVLPPSIHPDTQRPYEWRGDYTRIPVLPACLLVLWRALAKPQQHKSHSAGDGHEAWLNALLAGDDLHNNARALIARMAAKGVEANVIRAAFDALRPALESARGADRVRELFDAELERLITGADKFREPANDAQPLDIFRVPVAPAIPPELFPAVLRKYALPVAKSAGHDPSAYLMACLAAAAAAIDDNVRIQLRRQSEFYQSARLWVLLIGPSSAAKSPALKAATKPLFDLHSQLRRDYAAKVAGMTEDDARREPVPTVLVADTTIEALRDTLRDNPRGVVAVYEELDSWIGSHDAYRAGAGKDRGEWLRLYDGGPHTVDRATGPAKQRHVFVPNWGAGILGATTYAALRRHAKNLPPDGLLQRFLIVNVAPMAAWDDTGHSSNLKPERDAFEACLLEMRQLSKCTIKLSAEATRLLSTRQAEITAATDAVESLSADLAAHLGKHIGLLGRVALTLHCIEHRQNALLHEVSGAAMQAADQLLRVLLKHAAAMYGQIGRANESADLAKAIGAAIVAGSLMQLMRSDLSHACRAFRDASEHARDAALRYLEDAAWLTPVLTERQYAGRPTRYAVNPRVHDLFADAGEALKQRRAAVREVFA